MVEWKKIGDIMQIVRGASPRPIKNYITSDNNGVNWIKIGDVAPGAKYITRCNEKITKEGAEKSRYLHAGDFILSNSMSFGRPYILKIDGCIHDGWIAMSDYEKSVSSGYLYEILNSKVVQDYWKMKANNGGAMTNLNSDIVKDTIIPIPSLSEQNRIVGILDTFTASIDSLKEQIAQRRKQYEYYRDQLLDLEGKEGVEMKALGEVCEISRGVRVVKRDLEEFGIIPVFQNSLLPLGYYAISNNNGNTFVIIGGAAGDIGYSEKPFWAADDCLCISGKKVLVDKYIYNFLISVQHYLKSQVRKAGVPRLSRSVLDKLCIPVPPLTEQHRIVSILDAFEASIQNLEAQLSQREKQYEYYRNKLLTFE